MDKVSQLKKQKEVYLQEIYEIGDWLRWNTKHPDFTKQVDHRHQLTIKVELVNQRLKRRWNVKRCKEVVNLRNLVSNK